ncbi:ABC transporter permease [Sphingomonas sp. LR61]
MQPSCCSSSPRSPTHCSCCCSTNPARAICDKPCTPDRLREVQAFLGTDKPWLAQFGAYLAGIFTGCTFGSGASVITCAAPCFGYSFQLHESVTDLILSRLPVTASIAVGAAVLWLVAGVFGGAVSAPRRGTFVDRAVMTVAVAGVSSPAYLIGLLGILLFGFVLGILPTSGYVAFTDDPVGWFTHLILPWCVLAFISAAIYARLTRGEMLESMSQDFVRTARAKGLRERQVVVRHGLRTAILPVVTLFGPRPRVAARRCGHHREGVLDAGPRRAAHRRRAHPRPAGRRGLHVVLGAVDRHGERDRRRGLRVRRPRGCGAGRSSGGVPPAQHAGAVERGATSTARPRGRRPRTTADPAAAFPGSTSRRRSWRHGRPRSPRPPGRPARYRPAAQQPAGGR